MKSKKRSQTLKSKRALKDRVKKHEKKEDTMYRKLQRENKKFERYIK